MSLDEERPGLGDDDAETSVEEDVPPGDAFALAEGGEHGEGDAAGTS